MCVSRHVAPDVDLVFLDVSCACWVPVVPAMCLLGACCASAPPKGSARGGAAAVQQPPQPAKLPLPPDVLPPLACHPAVPGAHMRGLAGCAALPTLRPAPPCTAPHSPALHRTAPPCPACWEVQTNVNDGPRPMVHPARKAHERLIRKLLRYPNRRALQGCCWEGGGGVAHPGAATRAGRRLHWARRRPMPGRALEPSRALSALWVDPWSVSSLASSPRSRGSLGERGGRQQAPRSRAAQTSRGDWEPLCPRALVRLQARGRGDRVLALPRTQLGGQVRGLGGVGCMHAYLLNATW